METTPMRWCRPARAPAVAAIFAMVTLRCGPVGKDGPPAPPPDGGDEASGGGSDGSSGGAAADGATDATVATGDGGAAIHGLHVSGNKFVDDGAIVRLLGVDHSGTEYQCVNTGTTIFEGPTDSSLVMPMKTWNVNTVRVPLNEDCWLGINGVAAAVSGSAYQQAIASFVQMLRNGGMYVIVDLHWNGPGTILAKAQQPMPDADHAEDFWKSVAATFMGDMGVVFDLYNEPYPDHMPGGSSNPGDCLRNGCVLSSWSDSQAHRAVGMQQLVTDIRGVGARNVLMIGGWAWANALGQWLQYEPTDPLSNVAASFHNYNYTGCNGAGCWAETVQPVAARVPVVTGELGENDCAQTYVDSFFAWADPLGISYLGWSWNTQSCSSFPALITDYSGTPTAFGQAFKAHLPTQ